MASFTFKLLFCFIVTLLCFIDHNVEAREGKLFFTKFQPPAAAPKLAQANGRLGDGPFGEGSGMIPQTKESWPVSSTTTDAEFEQLMDTFDEENKNKLPDEFEEDEDVNEQKYKYNNNNNNGYSYNNYNENRRVYGNEEEERQEMSDTRGRGNDNPNEFETMEEYYKSLEGSQEEYEP